MGLEGADGSLCHIPPVHGGRDKLVSHTPLLFHQICVLLAALVIEDLEIYKEVLVFQMLYDDVVGVEAGDIFSRREGLDKDDVRGVVGNHDVLVPTPCSDGEAACVETNISWSY